MSATREQLLEAALGYAAGGRPVFRCKPGLKVPLDGSGGFKDATTNPELITRWWRGAAFNIAMPTGPMTNDVLDVDQKPTGSGWAALNRLKRAGLVEGAQELVRSRTGGVHLYFAGTDQPSGRLVDHHLDFKARGGYVLLPPSWVDEDDKGPAGGYELLDHRGGDGARFDWEAARRLLDPPKPHRSRPSSRPASLSPRLREMIRGDVADSNTVGGWSNTLYAAGCRYGELGASLEEALADLVAAAAPWNHHEARRAEMHVRNGWQHTAGSAA